MSTARTNAFGFADPKYSFTSLHFQQGRIKLLSQVTTRGRQRLRLVSGPKRSLLGKGSWEDEAHLQIHCHLYAVLKVGTSPSKTISGMFRGTVGPKNKSIFSAGRLSPYWYRQVLQAFSWKATVSLNHHLPSFVFFFYVSVAFSELWPKETSSLSHLVCVKIKYTSHLLGWINLVQTIVECIWWIFFF